MLSSDFINELQVRLSDIYNTDVKIKNSMKQKTKTRFYFVILLFFIFFGFQFITPIISFLTSLFTGGVKLF